MNHGCGVCLKPDCPECQAMRRRSFGGWRAAAPAPQPESPPCRYRGDELTAPERIARRLSHQKRWTYCLHADRPHGDVVCPCKGCNPTCPGYAE